MSEPSLVKDILGQISSSISTILKRVEKVHSSDDFISTEAGQEKLDAVCMQLIAMGESLKKIDKITESQILSKYPEIEWKKIMGIRDIISHHYFDVDAEIIFDVCENHLPELSGVIEKIIADL